MIFKKITNAKIRKLQRQLADLQAALEAERLKIKVVESERDSLAAVVARDRQRIQAEGAAYARRRAESEGVPQNEHERTV